jgi:hypothetical protein
VGSAMSNGSLLDLDVKLVPRLRPDEDLGRL